MYHLRHNNCDTVTFMLGAFKGCRFVVWHAHVDSGVVIKDQKGTLNIGDRIILS